MSMQFLCGTLFNSSASLGFWIKNIKILWRVINLKHCLMSARKYCGSETLNMHFETTHTAYRVSSFVTQLGYTCLYIAGLTKRAE